MLWPERRGLARGAPSADQSKIDETVAGLWRWRVDALGVCSAWTGGAAMNAETLVLWALLRRLYRADDAIRGQKSELPDRRSDFSVEEHSLSA